MFDHSVAVISNISKSLKKYLDISSIITQLLFMGYYAYLIVINVSKLQFLISYSFIEAFAFAILIVDIVSIFRDLDHHGRRMKAKTKRIIHYFSWMVKVIVIIFNIILLVRGEVSEVGSLFLIFSGVFLIIQILITLMSTLFSYYLDLFLYGLKMDYENIIDEEASNKRPLGRMLGNITKDMDYRDNINEISIKHEVNGAIKKELESEFPLKINGKLVKRRKAERIILHYYAKANKYYLSHNRLSKLLKELEENHITYLTSDTHLYVLLFFANNHLSKTYKGLSEYALKLIIATLIFINEGNDRSIIDLSFNAIKKELFDVNNWSEVINHEHRNSEYYKVLDIVKEEKSLEKKNREATIATELGAITFKEIEKKYDIPKPVSKIIGHFINKK